MLARHGDEIAHLYIRDQVSIVIRPVKELKGFKRLRLHSGETQHFRNMGFQQIVKPGCVRAFFQGHSDSAAHAMNERQNGIGLGYQYRPHHQLAVIAENRSCDACLVYIETNKLGVSHQGVAFAEKRLSASRSLKPTPKGTPSYNACFNRRIPAQLPHSGVNVSLQWKSQTRDSSRTF